MNKKVVYQVYLPSFKDENGDGLGDFKGVESKLEYIKSLGAEYVWISPFFKSPMKDNGYDVEDFYEVNPSYGTKQDLKSLVDKAEKVGLKMMIDFVFNHSSDKHVWFTKALEGDEKYKTYYHFLNKSELTEKSLQIKSVFETPIFNKVKDEYYFGAFSTYQPDLNWSNKDLRNELKEIVKYWIDFGFKGIRLDVFNVIDKDKTKLLEMGNVWDIAEGKNVNKYWKEVLEYATQNDVYIVAEANAPAKNSLAYTIPVEGSVNSIFTFDHMDWRIYKDDKITLNSLFEKIFIKMSEVNNNGGDLAIALDNHDNPRIINSLIDKTGASRVSAALLLNTLNIINTSSSYIYQGNEFGLMNPNFTSRNQLRDIASLNSSSDEKSTIVYSRDNARSPMPWDHTKNKGFSNANSIWLDNPYKENLEENLSKEILQATRKLINIKSQIQADAKINILQNNELIIYEITSKENSIITVINAQNKEATYNNNYKVIFETNATKNIEAFGVKIYSK